jgi:hypothetical protein
MSITTATSPAIAFLIAARDAMPSTLGDRVRIQAMGEAMSIAVRCRFKFNKDDGQALANGRFGIETSVGVFRPLDESYYAEACSHGGTYARMWESWTETKPWMAPRVLSRPTYRGGATEVLADNRVAPGLGILIASPPTQDDEAGLARAGGDQVWWCTSLGKDEIVICRYRYQDGMAYPFQRDGAPARRMKLTRAQWAAQTAPKAAETVAAPEAVAA